MPCGHGDVRGTTRAQPGTTRQGTTRRNQGTTRHNQGTTRHNPPTHMPVDGWQVLVDDHDRQTPLRLHPACSFMLLLLLLPLLCAPRLERPQYCLDGRHAVVAGP